MRSGVFMVAVFVILELLVGFDTNKKSKSIIQAMVSMADKINIKTLSEGVETKEEVDFLEKIGCGRLQGYLFSKPITYSELEQKITAGELVLDNELL